MSGVYNVSVIAPTTKQRIKHAKDLAEGENIVAAFGVSARFFWLYLLNYLLPLLLGAVGFYFLGQILPIWIFVICYGLFVVFVLWTLPGLLRMIHLRHSKTYILTDRRILIKDGIFSVRTISAPYDKITHITVREDFIPKLLYGIGDITIHTAAAGPAPIEIDIVKVAEPLKVKNLLEDLMTKEKQIILQAEKGKLIHRL